MRKTSDIIENMFITLDSEWNEGSNGFTMMFIFFSSILCTDFRPEGETPTFSCSTFSESKSHQDGTLKMSFFDFLNSFLTRRDKLPKNYEKPLKMGFRQYHLYSFFAIISKIIILLS